MKCIPDILFEPNRGLALDLYLPETMEAEAVVLYAHGGGFRKGSRDSAEVAYFAQAITGAGLAMASVSYRLSTGMEAFSPEDRELIESYRQRSLKVGLTLSPNLYGPEWLAATEDLSCAMEYLWVEGDSLGLYSRQTGILGVSSGGIAGLSLAYPPLEWVDRLSKPDVVVSIAGAIVQPWRLGADGPRCLMFHGTDDKIIDAGNLHLAAMRAQQVGAPVSLIETETAGHNAQVDVVLDGSDSTGNRYIDLVLLEFERLRGGEID